MRSATSIMAAGMDQTRARGNEQKTAMWTEGCSGHLGQRTSTLQTRCVYYIEVIMEAGLSHRDNLGGRVYGAQLDQENRFRSSQ